jgi:hypothetical protein
MKSARETARPFFLHGWDYLRFIEAGDFEALCLSGKAEVEGPAIVYNENFVDYEELENPHLVRLWPPQCLFHIAEKVLSESLASADGIGRFNTPAWSAYRNAICTHITMPWEDFLEAARREGIVFMAECAASCLTHENDLFNRLQAGRPVLVE